MNLPPPRLLAPSVARSTFHPLPSFTPPPGQRFHRDVFLNSLGGSPEVFKMPKE